MAWIRLDDNVMDHPKVAGLSDRGFRVWVVLIGFCNRYLTDGLLQTADIAACIPHPKRRATVLDELLQSGLLMPIEGGYELHDYLVYQKSKEQVEAERAKNSARQENYRERHKDTPRRAPRNAVSNAPPDPTRPGPSSLSSHIEERERSVRAVENATQSAHAPAEKAPPPAILTASPIGDDGFKRIVVTGNNSGEGDQ